VKRAACSLLLLVLLLSSRDAVNDMALHFLAKMKILVVKDIERDDIEFISKVGTVCCVVTASCAALNELKVDCATIKKNLYIYIYIFFKAAFFR